jgi:hypothetical protein
LDNALQVGTDCVVFAGVAVADSNSHVVVIKCFREQNVVCKFVLFKVALKGASKDAQVRVICVGFLSFYVFFLEYCISKNSCGSLQLCIDRAAAD